MSHKFAKSFQKKLHAEKFLPFLTASLHSSSHELQKIKFFRDWISQALDTISFQIAHVNILRRRHDKAFGLGWDKRGFQPFEKSFTFWHLFAEQFARTPTSFVHPLSLKKTFALPINKMVCFLQFKTILLPWQVAQTEHQFCLKLWLCNLCPLDLSWPKLLSYFVGKKLLPASEKMHKMRTWEALNLCLLLLTWGL